jgi:uncharacterized damage-inducible protein DinB
MSDPRRQLSGHTFTHARVTDAHVSWVELTDASIQHTGVRRVRMRGVELQDVEIDGELENLVINGVDVAPLIESELARRDPEYARMKPTTADEFRRAWEILERRWRETVERARRLDPLLLHERVDGEWSFIETLRHLCYATDAWVNRVYLGDPDPWAPLDLPFDTLRDLQWSHDRDVRPTLDEVLEIRAERQGTVRRVLADLTDDDLGRETAPVEGEGWPPADSYPVAEVLGIVVNEEWQHRRFAERDLAVLIGR